ncbi:MAG: TIGR00296 family protein [Methanomethylophilus sp.]
MAEPAEGAAAVRAARKAAEAETAGRICDPALPESFSRPQGVFVTISEYPSGGLRGCIGYPEPVFPLKEALVLAARAAACHDPRFPPMRPGEADRCIFEVTLLTVPESIKFDTLDELKAQIRIGTDGLIITYRGNRGLFLPQVPVEWHWNVEEYLNNLARKAGLPPDTWRKKGASFARFQGEIFTETEPHGDVVRQ